MTTTSRDEYRVTAWWANGTSSHELSTPHRENALGWIEKLHQRTEFVSAKLTLVRIGETILSEDTMVKQQEVPDVRPPLTLMEILNRVVSVWELQPRALHQARIGWEFRFASIINGAIWHSVDQYGRVNCHASCSELEAKEVPRKSVGA